MDVSVKYLRPNPKTGILEFRRTFPAKLLPFATDDTGKRITEVKRSLGVRVFDAGRDGRAYGELMGLYDRLASSALKASTGTYDEIEQGTIKRIADRLLSVGLGDHEYSRFVREPEERKAQRVRNLKVACCRFDGHRDKLL